MRICLLSQMYPRRDAPAFAPFIARQARALAEAGAEVTVVAPMQAAPWPLWFHPRWRAHGQVPRASAMEGVRVERVRYLSPPGMKLHFVEGLTFALALRRFAGAFDVVHANRLFPEGVAALALGRRLGAAVVAMARGMDLNLIPGWGAAYRRQLARVIAEADALVSVSEALAADLREIAAPPRPVHVVYNGVDEVRELRGAERAAARERLGLPHEALVAVYAGRLEPDKGTPELLRAFSGAARRAPGLHLACAGAVRSPAYREDARRLGLAGRVSFLGERPQAEVHALFGAADIFVFPSRIEGVPNAVLEAMRAGLPVVATRAGGTAEVVPETAGRLVAVGDVRALEDALVALAHDGALRERLGAAGRAHAASRFTWRASAEALLSIYGQAAGTARGGLRAAA